MHRFVVSVRPRSKGPVDFVQRPASSGSLSRDTRGGAVSAFAESGFAFLRVPVSACPWRWESGVALLDGADAFFPNPPTRRSGWRGAVDRAVEDGRRGRGHPPRSPFHQDAGPEPRAWTRRWRPVPDLLFGRRRRIDEVVIRPKLRARGSCVAAGVMRLVSPGLGFGGTVGYVKERVENSSAGTWAFLPAVWNPSSLADSASEPGALGGSPHLRSTAHKARRSRSPRPCRAALPTLPGSETWALPRPRRAQGVGPERHRARRRRGGWSALAIRVGEVQHHIGHFTAGPGVNSGRFTSITRSFLRTPIWVTATARAAHQIRALIFLTRRGYGVHPASGRDGTAIFQYGVSIPPIQSPRTTKSRPSLVINVGTWKCPSTTASTSGEARHGDPLAQLRRRSASRRGDCARAAHLRQRNPEIGVDPAVAAMASDG